MKWYNSQSIYPEKFALDVFLTNFNATNSIMQAKKKKNQGQINNLWFNI